MPRKPIEWSKCIIYKIWKDDDFYVGSTTDLASRKRNHKNTCNNENVKDYNLKIYQTIREKGGWDAWLITPLEEYKECQTQVQARIREEELRVKINANLNMRKAFTDKEQLKDYIKQYQQEHKEQIKDYNKQYYQEHKEKIKEYNAQWWQEHKEKINAKFQCECGIMLQKTNKSRHEKSIIHQNYLATLI